MFTSQLPKLKVTKDLDPQIAQAKKFPITNLYTGVQKKMGKIVMGCCPFHKEDTPSLAMYLETNTFHCFGCKKSGDVIAFYMQLKGVDFKTAVEELQ